MDNLFRRNQILDLLRQEAIGTQAALRRKLAHRGIRVTQTTVSRDMEELGVIKTRDGYRLPGPDASRETPTAASQPTLVIILKEFLRDARHAASLVVIKTNPGTAHTIAAALDTAGWKEIVGTVAGDDTIFLATASAKDAARVQKRIMHTVAE
ncbi:MAG: arginine repressor [Terriglobia bacterium]